MHRKVSDILRACALVRQGDRSLKNLRLTEWDMEFETLMRNRLIMGSLRYFSMLDARPPVNTPKVINFIQEKLNIYKETGNLEMLVDIANLAMIEFRHSDHPEKHFKSIDRED